ncbi:MAG: hypothetical protein U0324_32000 [Polyangiales bacterium]
MTARTAACGIAFLASLLPAAVWAQPAPTQPAPAPTQPAPAPSLPAPAAAMPAAAVPAAPARPSSPVIVLRDVDREMTSLSNDITASHARLREITAMVLQQSGGGAQLIIDHQNEMGSTFRLVRASYALDGATVATRTDDNGSLADQTGFSVYNGRVASGEHTLTVSLEYQGNGYGIFSYIRGYTFRSRSVQTFTVPEARALRLVVVGYERGGATVAIEDRPAIRYTQTVMTIPEAQQALQRADATAAAASAAPPAAAPAPAPAQR